LPHSSIPPQTTRCFAFRPLSNNKYQRNRSRTRPFLFRLPRYIRAAQLELLLSLFLSLLLFFASEAWDFAINFGFCRLESPRTCRNPPNPQARALSPPARQSGFILAP